MEKESSSIIAKAKNYFLTSKDSKEIRVRLKNLELIIYTGSILDCKVDAIVNSLDPSLEFKNKMGLVKAIYEKFGPKIEVETKRIAGTLHRNNLFKKCIMVKSGCEIPKFILNAITPYYSVNHEEFSAGLFNTFENILNEAKNNKLIKSIAIPLLATGNYGAPKKLCSNILLNVIKKFDLSLSHENSSLKEIQLVNLDKEATRELIKILEQFFPNESENGYKHETSDIEANNHSKSPWTRDERSMEKNNVNENKEHSIFVKLRGDLDQILSCDLCRQRIKIQYLNVLKICKHKYCLGCTIDLCNNKYKCLLADHLENEKNEGQQEPIDYETNDSSIREKINNEEITNEVQIKECQLCCEEIELVYLYKCRHEMCVNCFKKTFEISPKCPFCFRFYRTPRGDQPEDGTMKHRLLGESLPGYSNCQTIQILYYIPNGIQGPNHPNPGQSYSGINREAYLPDNKEGREILKLLCKAFEYGLTFTIGNSRTTNAQGVITWNDIHHKTSMNGSPFGYPDENYLKRVKDELKSKGIE